MAINQGVAQHNAWLVVQGTRYAILRGTITLNNLSESNDFNVRLPLNAPGYLEAFAKMEGDVEWEVVVLAHGNEQSLASGHIDKIDYRLTQGVMHVSGRDIAATQIHNTKSNQKWSNQTGNQVNQDVMGRLGIPYSGMSGGVMVGKKLKDTFARLSDNVTVAHILQKNAAFDGGRWRVDKEGAMQYQVGPNQGGNVTLFWKRSQPGQPMQSDCLDLRVVHNLEAGRPQEANVSGYHPYDKKTYSSTVTMSGAGSPVKHSQNMPNVKQEQAFQAAKAQAESAANHEFEIIATIVGDPSIDPDMKVALTGTGFFDQEYDIDKVTHNFGYDGFTTSINSKGKKNGRETSGQ